MEDLQKLGSYSILDKQFLCFFVFAVFLANTHQKLDFWGCFGILRISSLGPSSRGGYEEYSSLLCLLVTALPYSGLVGYKG